MAEDPRVKYELECPDGGAFHICAGFETEFVGCCLVNPCTEDLQGSCPDHSLTNATFAADAYDYIGEQDCVETPDDGTLWFTCAANSPPFMGCCNNQNPCADGGCAAENLRVAVLSSDEDIRKNLTEGLPASETTSRAVISPTSTAVPDSEPAGDGGLSKGAIIGIAVGAGVAAILIVAFIMFRLGVCFRKKVAEKRETPGNSGDEGVGHPMSPSGKPAPYRESYMTATTAYSPIPPHGTPDYSKHPNSPPPHAHSPGFVSPDPTGANRWSEMTPNSRHVSSLIGYSGHTFNTPHHAGAPWPGTSDGLGVQMQPVAELADTGGADRPISELPPTTATQHFSELPANEETRR